jgi:small conductance mechanosensitive channel
MNVNAYLEQAKSWLLTSGLQIVLTLVLAFVALRLANVLARKLSSFLQKRKDDVEFQKRADTLSSVIRYALDIVIIGVAAIMIMGELGIEIGPILAAAGIVGLAVGFGAQSLVKDVISGFFILLEDQIRVGDVIQAAGKGGLVERVNLRMTVLRDLSGNVHFIPNGQIDLVTNMTKEYSRYVFDVGVAYREDVDEVIGVIKEVDENLRKDPEYRDDIIEPIEVLGLDQFADSAIVIKARTTTKPIKQWRVAREFNRRLKKAFDERDIEIPFPHQTLYIGKDKEGKSPPLNVMQRVERSFAETKGPPAPTE